MTRTYLNPPSLFPDLVEPAKPTPAPYVRDSATSEAAAKSVESRTARGRQQILRLLLENPEGMTDQDLGWAMSADGSFVRPRRIELQKLGLIFNSLTTRPTHSGRAACVWVHGNFATDEMRVVAVKTEEE